MPPCGTLPWGLSAEQVFPAQSVEIKSPEQKDGVVEVVLIFQCEFGHGVESQDAVVVGAAQACEKAVRNCEERHVFNVRVVFRRIGDNVVDVVISLPPAETQSSKIVGYEDTKNAVGVEVVSNAHMACIMGSENQLMPETA